MKCKKCKHNNIIKASYCEKCGNKFTEAEKKEALNKTIYGKINKLEKLKSIVTLEIITGNIFFKVISLLVVLGIGIYLLITVGINTKILSSQEYQIFYNKKANEYYLITDDNKDRINVSLYRPNRVSTIKAYHYNTTNEIIEEKDINKETKVELTTYNNDYYILATTYNNKKKDDLKVFVYHKSDL